MTAEPTADEGLLTIDELALAVGLTVRTTRYYASLGLIPAPLRRGRMAYYDQGHQARLELIRALQEHGFTLQAIEDFLESIPVDSTVEELALQRAMLTSWTPRPPETVTREELERKAGRKLTDRDVDLLVKLGTAEYDGDKLRVLPNFRVGLELLDLDIPEDSMGAAGEAIQRHMESLVEELTEILRSKILEPYRRQAHVTHDAERLERTMVRLRQLTLEAIVTGFQRAANAVITRSLAR